MEYFKNCVLKHYADFNGRARRKEYWFYILFQAIAIILASFVGGALDYVFGLPGVLTSAFSMIVALGLCLPSLAVSIRRLHDVGKSGWFILIGLVPVVGGIILIIFSLLDSQPGSNAYGPNPKGK